MSLRDLHVIHAARITCVYICVYTDECAAVSSMNDARASSSNDAFTIFRIRHARVNARGLLRARWLYLVESCRQGRCASYLHLYRDGFGCAGVQPAGSSWVGSD